MPCSTAELTARNTPAIAQGWLTHCSVKLRFAVSRQCSTAELTARLDRTRVARAGGHGAGNRNRTYDLIITNDALYQLSYSGEGAEYSGGACDAQGSWHHQQPAALDSGALDPRRPVESSV